MITMAAAITATTGTRGLTNPVMSVTVLRTAGSAAWAFCTATPLVSFAFSAIWSFAWATFCLTRPVTSALPIKSPARSDCDDGGCSVVTAGLLGVTNRMPAIDADETQLVSAADRWHALLEVEYVVGIVFGLDLPQPVGIRTVVFAFPIRRRGVGHVHVAGCAIGAQCPPEVTCPGQCFRIERQIVPRRAGLAVEQRVAMRKCRPA